MSLKKINLEYLRIPREIPFFLKFIFIKKRNNSVNSKKILVVNTSLIGEFVVTLPALREFIIKSKTDVDLMVSPPLENLAKRIRGVRQVFIAKSNYNRNSEMVRERFQKFNDYDKVIILRSSKDSYDLIKKINTRKIETALLDFVIYGFHLMKSLAIGKTPKQWIEVNFEMLGVDKKKVLFEEIFDFNKKDYEKLKRLDVLKTNKKIIIIHTSSEWPMKKWSNENWVRLLKKINGLGDFRIIFIGTKKDKQDYNSISKSLDFPVYSLAGRLDLVDLILLFRLSDYFIGVDSGPKSIAHISDLRSITLLGPGPHMYLPMHKKDIFIDKTKGRGVYQMFFHKKTSFINKIDVEEVYESFKKLIKHKSKN